MGEPAEDTGLGPTRYLSEIAWKTEGRFAEAASHLIGELGAQWVPLCRWGGCRDRLLHPVSIHLSPPPASRPVEIMAGGPPPRPAGSGFSIGHRKGRKADGADPDERQRLDEPPEPVLSLLPA